MLLTCEHRQEVETLAVGIDHLFQHQQALLSKALEKQCRASELHEAAAALVVELTKKPLPPARLSLRASLEAVARLGPEFLLSSGSDEWTAGELLYLFHKLQPMSLSVWVALIPPEATSDGAIYEVDPKGNVITDAPLFRITRCEPAGIVPF